MKINKIKKSGFTLIEMLVVLFIISMLVALITPNLIGARDRAKDAAKRQEMVSLKNALRLYYNDKGKYPDSPGGTAPPLATLNTGNYLPSVGTGVMTGIGYSVADTTNDSFYLFYEQSTAAGEEDDNSQINCGLAVVPKRFTICVK